MLPRICVGNRVQREKGTEKGQEREKFCLIPVETESLEDSAEFKIIFLQRRSSEAKGKEKEGKKRRRKWAFFHLTLYIKDCARFL